MTKLAIKFSSQSGSIVPLFIPALFALLIYSKPACTLTCLQLLILHAIS